MKEITKNILIDTSLSGVTLGVIQTKKGVIFIDSPLMEKDVQSWRTIATKSNSGPNRLQIILDEHYDRTVYSVPIKCPILSHAETAMIIQSRPANFRTPPTDTGSEWEKYSDIGPLQWIQPEITFTREMKLEWDDETAVLMSVPGPSKGSIWVEIPSQKVLFIGDTVIKNEPPFFENANIDLWLKALDTLKSKDYQEYIIISGRSGIIRKDDVQAQIKFLNSAKRRLEKYSSKKTSASQIEKYAQNLSGNFSSKISKIQDQYLARLQWGLIQYYNKNLRKPSKKK